MIKCECGEMFEKTHPGKVYCSGRCRVRASVRRYRERKAVAPIYREGGRGLLVNEYGCGCKKDGKAKVCKVHKRA